MVLPGISRLHFHHFIQPHGQFPDSGGVFPADLYVLLPIDQPVPIAPINPRLDLRRLLQLLPDAVGLLPESVIFFQAPDPRVQPPDCLFRIDAEGHMFLYHGKHGVGYRFRRNIMAATPAMRIVEICPAFEILIRMPLPLAGWKQNTRRLPKRPFPPLFHSWQTSPCRIHWLRKSGS